MVEDSTKRRVALTALSSLVLVLVGIALFVGIAETDSQADGNGKAHDGEVSASNKAVQAICQPTEYKDTCIKALEKAGANTTDPKELVKAGIDVTVRYIREAATKSVTLKELARDPRSSQALENCKELLEYAVDDLSRTTSKLDALDLSEIDNLLLDLKTWLSAAMTYQETCLDGFENATGNAGQKMRESLKTSMELTSNGLTMVTQIYKILTDLDIPQMLSRRLLQEEQLLGHGEMPDWIEPVRRRLLESRRPVKANLIVAQDGSGKYKTIDEALKDIPLKSKKTFVLYIKRGIYKENVIFPKKMDHLVVIGDGPTKTIISGRRNFVDGIQTFATATVSVLGNHFMAKDIGFENTAGAIKHQAVALRVQSDWSVFYNCRMDGYQDTLYVHAKRQFYRDCTVTGTIDFVFGNALAVFQNCNFLIRAPLQNQDCIVTAQGRKKPDEPTGIVLQNCTIAAHHSYAAVSNVTKSYLGRPWKEYSRTVIMQSYISNVIHPTGWLPWLGTVGLDTLYYTELKNRGPGSSTARRVKWKGIKTISAKQALEFTADNFILGKGWIPRTGVPFVPGMMNL